MRYLGFPVTFGYMEKTVLSGGRQYTHRGIDLGSWVGDRLVIQGKNVAITGDTGLVEGPHTHVQAGRDEWSQATINPAPYIGKPGRVVKVGYANEWGNYVAIRVGDVNVFYCHLQKATVSVGDEISNLVVSKSTPNGEGNMNKVSSFGVDLLFRTKLGRTCDPKQKQDLMKTFDLDGLKSWIENLPEYKEKVAAAKRGEVNFKDFLVQEYRGAYRPQVRNADVKKVNDGIKLIQDAVK